MSQGKKVIMIGSLIVFGMALLFGVITQSLFVFLGFFIAFLVALPAALLGSKGTGTGYGTGYSTGTGALSNYDIYNNPRDLGNISQNIRDNR